MSNRSRSRVRLRTLPALALAAVMALPGTAPAQDLTEAATAIEQLLATGRGPEAVAAGRMFLRHVTGEAGFGVTNARLTLLPAEGYGMFEPRPTNVYALGEPVYAYVEVYGFSMTPLANGANRLLFDVSFTLDSPEGRQMTDAMIPMGEVQLDSFSQPVDGFFHLTYRVTGAEGPFTLRTHVVDRASGQTAEFSLPVVFGAAPASADRK
ncbi:hypothetical protein [Pararhodobacter aggregans]